MEKIDYEEEKVRIEVSSKNKEEYIKKKTQEDYNKFVRTQETDILYYSEKYSKLKEELEKNPPKLKSKLSEKQKKLSLYKFKIEQARSKIENAEEIKESAMSQQIDDFFSHANFSKFNGHKTRVTNKFREIETSNGNKYLINDFNIQLLYDHQIEGLHWFLEQHSAGRGSLLSDEMGLGKTITSLSLLSCLHTTHLNSDRKTFGVCIIACPATLQDQWKAEAKLWATAIDVINFSQDIGSKKKLHEIFKKYMDTGCIIIATYESLRIHRKWFENVSIYYVILDEGHKIKNPRAGVTIAIKQLDIEHRVILTGTPIQNSIEELWCLIDFIQPGKLSSLEVFRDEYCSHILKAGSSKATNIEIAMSKECSHRLRGLIRPHVLRRTKVMLTKSCSLQSKNEYIVFCNPSTPQILITMNLRNQIINRSRIKFNDNFYTPQEDLGLISKARKIANHPFLLFWDETEEKVTFDMISTENEEIKTRDQLISLIFKEREKSGKLKILEKLLIEWKNDETNKTKVLIFSQTKIILDIASLILNANNMKFKRIDGDINVRKRMDIINEFTNEDDCFAMILTTRVGGLGLNLKAANKIIIFDPDWNPMVDMQASDRASRIGQKQEVTVYRFVLTDTVEEFIYQKQIFKQFMADKILNNPGAKKIFKNRIFMEYLFVVPKAWKKLYKAAGFGAKKDDKDEDKLDKIAHSFIESINFNFGEIKEILMKSTDKKRDK